MSPPLPNGGRSVIFSFIRLCICVSICSYVFLRYLWYILVIFSRLSSVVHLQTEVNCSGFGVKNQGMA